MQCAAWTTRTLPLLSLVDMSRPDNLVHDDDDHLVGEELKQVLGVDVLDPLPSLHVPVTGDGLPQRLKPADEERLVIEQRQREPTVELLPLDLAVLLGGSLLGLCLRLDLPLLQPPMLRSPRRLPPPLHLSACFSRSSVPHRRRFAVFHGFRSRASSRSRVFNTAVSKPWAPPHQLLIAGHLTSVCGWRLAIWPPWPRSPRLRGGCWPGWPTWPRILRGMRGADSGQDGGGSCVGKVAPVATSVFWFGGGGLLGSDWTDKKKRAARVRPFGLNPLSGRYFPPKNFRSRQLTMTRRKMSGGPRSTHST